METFDNTSPIFEIFVYYDQDVSDVDYLNSLQLIINQFPSCDLSKSEFQKSIIATIPNKTKNVNKVYNIFFLPSAAVITANRA